MSVNQHTDKPSELWDEFRQGSKTAFERIYVENAKILLAYGRKINGDRQVVYDAVHELFNHIWSHRSNLGQTVSIKNYLLKSLRSRLYKLSQKHNNLNLEYLLYENENDFFESKESEIISYEETEVKKTLLKRAIIELSKREQEVLHLKFYEMLSMDEISDILGIKYQSVKNASFSAITKLRAFFKSHKEGL